MIGPYDRDHPDATGPKRELPKCSECGESLYPSDRTCGGCGEPVTMANHPDFDERAYWADGSEDT